MPEAARMGDKMKQLNPHCHAPIHPAAPTPTPSAHPPKPWKIITACAPTVFINSKQGAVVGSISEPCILPSCIPNGPGVVSKGSSSVFLCNLPAARKNDMTAHMTCVAPIPAPVGKIIAPCSKDVIIGG